MSIMRSLAVVMLGASSWLCSSANGQDAPSTSYIRQSDVTCRTSVSTASSAGKFPWIS